MSDIPKVVSINIKEANNRYLKEVHKEFINTHDLNMKDALILSKFLEFMINHE